MSNIKIVCASIVDDKLLQKANAIVNATNPYMIFGSGVSGAIFKKAGIKELESYCKEKWKTNMVVGEIRITPGFKIPCDIIFCQGAKVYDYNDYSLAEKDLLTTYENVLKTAKKKGYNSIILPSLGTGVYGFKHDKVARPVLSLLTNKKYETLEIFFVNYNQDICDYYKKVLEELTANGY